MHTIGLISPGAMGASVGAAAASNGHRVLFAGDGRSRATCDRAERAGLDNCGSIQAMVGEANVILSVCPPADALGIGAQIADSTFDGLYVDCNAISPSASRELSAHYDAKCFVDGGIIGGPAWQASVNTTLYLSGEPAGQVAEIFAGTPLSAQVLSNQVGEASALKMVFAAYTKGSTALLSAILGVAEAEGVRGALEAQWGEAFTRQTHERLVTNSAKAWRFSGEMEEIAATFQMAGFPSGFHASAAEIFERQSRFKNDPAEDIAQLIKALTR